MGKQFIVPDKFEDLVTFKDICLAECQRLEKELAEAKLKYENAQRNFENELWFRMKGHREG